MEKFLLDTNIWIEWFQQRNGVPEKMNAVGRDNLYVSEISLAELTFGAYNSGDFERHIKEVEILQNIVNVLDISEVFSEYAIIRCAIRKENRALEKSVGNFDILIGATALHYGLTVVTDNTKHFECMPGVKVVNWVERS